MKNLAVLVTGGSGFIGSHLVDSLLSRGYKVRVFDKIKPFNEKAEWFKGDISSREDAHDALQDIETVFHLAAVADVNVARTEPELCLNVNENGTLNLLRASSGRDIDRFILASTVWVYGKTEGVVTEETMITHPNDMYTKTKIGQEHLVYSWSKMHSLPYTILRYDIPYGPRMRSNMAIASFTNKALRNEPVTVYGDGNQGRCWIYVTDLAHANCLSLNQTARNEIINLAGGEFVTITQIVDLLKKRLGEFPVKREPSRPGDFQGVRTSIEKAQHLLGWRPATSFEKGLTEYIASVRQT